MKTADITNEYKEISAISFMEYEKKVALLEKFIETYSSDERKAVANICIRAEKEIASINSEIERVKGMMLFERSNKDAEFIAGVDEVGRGPLAGPICAGAVILPKDFVIPYLNDSKQVNIKRREELAEIIMKEAVAYGIGIVSEKDIDEFGIQAANYKAMRMAIENLKKTPELVLVDAVKIPEVPIRQMSIIKGDAKSVSIAAASIIAKVTRDKMMEEYDKVYPGYGFASNMGYGSAEHIAKIKADGPCEIHRRSFIKNFV